MVIQVNIMCLRRAFHFCAFFPKTRNSSRIMRKTSGVCRHSTNTWSVLLKTAKVVTDKERLRKCHRPEENGKARKAIQD